uniref:REM2- and Rab-like small GTPase 1 n=1 Tax=Macrostomum lignano TaxID=282301 RepID=A0A1I8FYB9_9PLAT
STGWPRKRGAAPPSRVAAGSAEASAVCFAGVAASASAAGSRLATRWAFQSGGDWPGRCRQIRFDQRVDSWRETPGLAVHRQFWPCRLRRAATAAATAPEEPPLLCHLQFWEAGDSASRSFEHLRNELRLACDCVLFVFSVADRASVAELPAVVRRTLDGGSEGSPPCGLLVATRLDQPEAQVVSRAELLQLERDCRLPLVRFSPDMPSESAWQLLTRLCECLWHRR